MLPIKMTLMKRLISAALLSSAALFTSCESIVDDLNVNPNEFTEVPTQLIFNQTVLNTVAIAEADPARISGMWSDQFAGTDRQYITTDRFEVSVSDFDEIWADLYQQGIAQAQITQAQADEEGLAAIANYASILEGYYATEAALMFGDVPYTQANDPEFIDPEYDSQIDVINTGIGLIEAGRSGAGADAPVTMLNEVYTGTSTWGELAAALVARYQLALGNYEAALAAAEAANFDELTDGIEFIHTSTNFSENLFFQFEGEQRADYLSFGSVGTTQSTLFNILSDTTAMSRADDKTNDAPRLAYFLGSLENNLYKLNISDTGFFGRTSNFPLMGYPELQLIMAEAAIRTGNREQAITSLNNARNYWDVQTGTDSYAEYDDGDFDDDDALLRAILTEKYVSVFGLPTFYDIIRTDNLIGADMDSRDTPAQRFLYPSTEIASNSKFPFGNGDNGTTITLSDVNQALDN